MKHKRVIIILLLGIWIIGILMFHIKANRRFSVILTSVDGMVSIEIPRATYFSECYANEIIRFSVDRCVYREPICFVLFFYKFSQACLLRGYSFLRLQV